MPMVSYCFRKGARSTKQLANLTMSELAAPLLGEKGGVVDKRDRADRLVFFDMIMRIREIDFRGVL